MCRNGYGPNRYHTCSIGRYCSMDNPQIEWTNKSGKQCLRFTFSGKFTEQDAVPALEKWRQSFASKPGERIPMIWDCLNMNDYDYEARTLWQNACKEMKDQIDSIWVMTNSLLIRMGASVISVFSSLRIKVVDSEEDIKLS